jgi:hypothetical protein
MCQNHCCLTQSEVVLEMNLSELNDSFELPLYYFHFKFFNCIVRIDYIKLPEKQPL